MSVFIYACLFVVCLLKRQSDRAERLSTCWFTPQLSAARSGPSGSPHLGSQSRFPTWAASAHPCGAIIYCLTRCISRKLDWSRCAGVPIGNVRVANESTIEFPCLFHLLGDLKFVGCGSIPSPSACSFTWPFWWLCLYLSYLCPLLIRIPIAGF